MLRPPIVSESQGRGRASSAWCGRQRHTQQTIAWASEARSGPACRFVHRERWQEYERPAPADPATCLRCSSDNRSVRRCCTIDHVLSPCPRAKRDWSCCVSKEARCRTCAHAHVRSATRPARGVRRCRQGSCSRRGPARGPQTHVGEASKGALAGAKWTRLSIHWQSRRERRQNQRRRPIRGRGTCARAEPGSNTR